MAVSILHADGQQGLRRARHSQLFKAWPGREGQVLGRVAEILSGAASPLLSVDTGRCRVLVPAVAAFVREVVPGSHVTVTPIDGMFDGEAEVAGDAADSSAEAEREG